MSTIVYNQAVATHARQGVESEYLLLKDSESFKLGIADKQFRVSYLVGAIGGMLNATDSIAADLLSKAAPLHKDAVAKAILERREAIKSGKVQERTADEQRAYNTAKMRFSRFCATHAIKPANKARGKAKDEAKAKGEAKDATPSGLTSANAESYVRMQAAVLKAYAEKNKAILPDAFRFAMLEFAEAIEHVPSSETKSK